MRGTRILRLLLIPAVIISVLPSLFRPSHTGADDLVADHVGFDTVDFVMAPSQPRNLAPAHGATGVSQTPTLQASIFSDPDVNDTHASSQWQLRIASGAYLTPTYDSGSDTTDLIAITIPLGVLSQSTTYGWHVRYQGSSGLWSDWSAETLFKTASKHGKSPLWIWIVVVVVVVVVAGAVAYVAASWRAGRVPKPVSKPVSKARSKPRYRITP